MLIIEFSTTSYYRGVEKAQNAQSPSITLTSRGHYHGSPEMVHSEKEFPFCQSAPSTHSQVVGIRREQSQALMNTADSSYQVLGWWT